MSEWVSGNFLPCINIYLLTRGFAVWINNYFRQVLGAPFGGNKDSGHGREHCMETLHEFTTAKTIRVPSGFGSIPVWRAVDEIFGKKH